MCAKPVRAQHYLGVTIRDTTTHPRVAATGKHIRATSYNQPCLGQAECTGDRREIDSYVGPLLANRIPAARRVVATAAAAVAAAVPARARRIRRARGMLQARKAYWFIGC